MYCGNNFIITVDSSGHLFSIVGEFIKKAVTTVIKKIVNNTGAAKPYKSLRSLNIFERADIKIHGEKNVDMKKYYNKYPNCYSAALGYNDTSRNPGSVVGLSPNFEDIDTYAFLVEEDLKALGRSVRRIDGPNDSITSSEYRIALRVRDGEDYHFMYQTATGQWAEKHGPGPSKLWDRGMAPDDTLWEYRGEKNYYNSNTVYFAVTY